YFVLFEILLYFCVYAYIMYFSNIFSSAIRFCFCLVWPSDRSSAFFLGGVALVLLRWLLIGMLVETYGFVLLFKSFFPMAFGFLATALNIPFLTFYNAWNKTFINLTTN
uniref:Uncharacterized protein n=1 Tax=Sinocyclocheilus grahami TaxID=75366 RepID=A0A672SQX4_SINGR